ncbi:putative dienelactone hydrolase [Hoeflea marina]|uniref:Putative dienelactone hydrolase n=1 Tax=Hoeflea marina TaxID=274592 RepID=A0A317PH43_9HYPH|nr:alpha/beta fold hydrolase [Hoeflea marina]PWV98768.1 putative dienelactone hydrolase [Hoeflea marina]
MYRCALFSLLLIAAPAASAQTPQAIGFKTFDIEDTGGDRPLHVGLWYPTGDAGPLKPVGENAVFYGVPSIEDARPAAGAHPLVVLSHGYSGTWRNLGWVAQALVEKGYVVAAPDHPGTTAFDRSPVEAARLWQRPRDLSRVIDALIAEPERGGKVDENRIAAVGHSLGGWTVAALGGARSDIANYVSDCKSQAELRACKLLDELGVREENKAELEADLSDPRVRAIASIDLGLARGFTPESLKAYRIPALVFGAGVDIGGLPAMLESGSLVENLPKATTAYVEIPDAMHFTFMQVCKPGAVEIIRQEEPGDEFVCQDPGPRDRAAIHRQVTDRIVEFLARSIP